jgi:hypothetical protein
MHMSIDGQGRFAKGEEQHTGRRLRPDAVEAERQARASSSGIVSR